MPLMGSTSELTLSMEAKLSCPKLCENGIDDHSSLVCHVVVKVRGRCPPLFPYHVLWTRELTLPFTSYSTSESGPCILLRQCSRADTVDWGTGDCALRRGDQRCHFPYGCVGSKERCPRFLPYPVSVCGRWQSWS